MQAGLKPACSRFHLLHEKFQAGVRLYLTLVAPFVGVLLAIAISNYESQIKEQQDLIK
ncbi:hypothetical protein [Bowmanella pacifica]|uniref:Uncharacterized protein n=1 Tax=Bowmanella pacifica TaxID=502051 RepID=A0A917YY78_9ALTE|nr:hypothetical protein [Bowmanella pacifica]GGO69949.1 hypothetical protein GCM10010982_22300 [Bowmanella pacifica]